MPSELASKRCAWCSMPNAMVRVHVQKSQEVHQLHVSHHLVRNLENMAPSTQRMRVPLPPPMCARFIETCCLVMFALGYSFSFTRKSHCVGLRQPDWCSGTLVLLLRPGGGCKSVQPWLEHP